MREHTKENTMSNFSFLKIENEYTKNEAYQKMTEYAVSAESYFYVMDIACAQYVRYAIEQYVQYVSAFYKIPYATQPAHLSHYLYGENAKQLVSQIGQYAFATLHTLNDISKAYCHAGIPRSDAKYNEMIACLYDLMVDLYLRIAGENADRPAAFSYEKITSVHEIAAPGGKKIRIVPTEEITSALPDRKPRAAAPAYKMTKQHGRILLLDPEGNVRNQYIEYDKYQGSEEEKKHLEEQIQELQNSYAAVVEKMTTELSGREDEISRLQEELQEGKAQNSQSMYALKKQIRQLEEEKRTIRIRAEEQKTRLQEKWIQADNKYQSLYATSTEEQKKLKGEIVELLRSRKEIYKELQQTEAEYSATIDGLKTELEEAKSRIDDYQSASFKNTKIIPQLKDKIEQLEQEKKDHLTEFEKRYAEIREEIQQLLESKEQQDQQNREWQNLVSQLLFENDYYKEFYIQRTRQEEKEYLAVVHNAVSKINGGTVADRQTLSEQMLREYLLKVKKAYEDMLENERKQTAYWKNKYEEEHGTPEEISEDVGEAVSEEMAGVGEPTELQPLGKREKWRKKKSFRAGLAIISALGLYAMLFFLIRDARNGETVQEERLSTAEEGAIVTVETEPEDLEKYQREEAAKATETISQMPTETGEGRKAETLVESTESHLPDGSMIQDSLNRKKPPKSWTEVEGVNEELLQEITTINRKVLDYYDINAEDYENLGYRYLGKCGIFNTSYTASIGTWYERGIFQERLYCNTNTPHIQFFYYRSGTNSQMGFAVLPQDLSTELSTQTTVEDLTALFAEEPSYEGEMDGVTDFSTADKEIGVTYKVGDVFDALFLFDENGVLCDYVYISASPEYMWD